MQSPTNQSNKAKLHISLKLVYTLTFIFILTLSTNLTTVLPTNKAKAYALTPPDSCFNFNSGTNTIEDYFDNENNDSGQPACPKAVDIPSTIGGTPVTTIGDSAFSENQLTSVTIPSSVTTIGNSAFFENQLTSIFLLGSPTTLGSGILISNPIESITINGNTYTSSSPNTDACFEFNAGNGTITKWLQADLTTARDGGSACLNKSVTIPSTISGVDVTTIGDYAFESNQLTSVTIPSSVTTIGGSAFRDNQLTSVTIGNGVASLDPFVFALNSDHTFADFELEMQQLEQQHKATWADPNNPTPAEQQAFMQEQFLLYYKLYTSAWYVPVYTADPSNPNNLQDASTSMTEADVFEMDANGNGNTTDPLFFGGHLINPAYAQINYQDQSGNTISPSTKVTGYNTDNSTNLTTYLAKDNPTSNMSFYHKVGSTAHLPTPPSIAGYSIVSTPPSTLTLSNAGANEITYTYKVDTNSDSDSDGIPDSVETNAPNSGDANNDGIADNTQANVSSYINPVTSSYSVLQVSSSCSITNVSSNSEDTNTTKDSAYSYPAGLMNFTIDCGTSGFVANITQYHYTNTSLTNLSLRKHNPNTNAYFTITNATLTNQTIDNKPVIISTYQVTDGGDLDIDNTANGIIVDPAGLASQAIGAPNTGL